MEQDKDKIKKSSAVSSRRKFLTKAGIAAPVVLTMASKPAFGATVCNISGFASVTPSGIARHTTQSCGGFSHGAWKNPDNGNSNGDGNRQHWYDAGIAPEPRPRKNHPDWTGNDNFATQPGVAITSDRDKKRQDPPATMFKDVFTHMTSDERTYEAVIEDNGSFDQFAAQTVLNALYFNWGPLDKKISAPDVVKLHEAHVKGWSSFQTTAGNTVDLTGIDIKAFFESTQH